jgi:hypothetical protein
MREKNFTFGTDSSVSFGRFSPYENVDEEEAVPPKDACDEEINDNNDAEEMTMSRHSIVSSKNGKSSNKAARMQGGNLRGLLVRREQSDETHWMLFVKNDNLKNRKLPRLCLR